METLSFEEINQVSGGSTKTLSRLIMTSGGASLGGYFGAVRLGATLGAAAGPVGAFVGGVAFGVAAYYIFSDET